MKYILFIITFFICSIAQSQVKVLGYITPNAPSDTYPTHLDINGAGGFMAMNTLAERDAIPTLRRKKGMMVYVADSVKTYQLQNDLTTWLPFMSNGGQSILQLASQSVLGGIKIGNDFAMGADSVLNISDFRKNLWNQIALLYQYSTTDSMLSKIDSATTAHEYTFNDTDFIIENRYVTPRHRYSPQDSIFRSSVAYNITQEDIDNWNASLDLSNFYTKSQVDSLIDSGFARHKYWFDGKTIKGEGTFPDPFHVDPFGDTTTITYLNEHTYTTAQVDSAIAANYHIYGAGYGLILDNSTFILDTAALAQAFYLNSVANSITQEDIDRWNEAVDFSNFYTKSQVDSAFAAQALASRIYFDGVTIQGDGTVLDPFHAVFGGDSGVANLYTRAQVDSAIAANYHIYGAGYGLLLQNSTFSVDTSVIHGGTGGSTIDTANRFISDVIGISSNTLRFIKGTGYFDVIIQNGGYTSAQVDSAIAAHSGVTTFNGRNGAVVPQLSDYSAYYASLASLNSKLDSATVQVGQAVDTLINHYPSGVRLVKGYIPKGKDGLVSGGLTTWSTGLTFDVTAATYYINGILYTSSSSSIILDAADPTLDRIDVIALDNTGAIIKLTGTPSATPVEPQADPGTQLYLTSVSIPAGSTQPLGVTSNIVYNENTSPDWTATAVGMTADANNTTAPYTGSKAVSTSGWTNGQSVNFIAGSNWSASTLAALKMYVRLKSVIPYNGAIYIRFFNGSTPVSNSVSMSNYGLNKALIGGYQNISMPVADFGFTGLFNKIQLYFGGTNADGVYIDYVQLQGGVGTQTNTNYIADIYRKPGTDSIFKMLNSKAVFAFKDIVGSISTGTVSSVATNTATGITGGTITSTGTIAADTTILRTVAAANKTRDSLGAIIATKGTGTVTSVGLTMSDVIYNASVTNSPVSTSGTLTPTLKTQSPYTLLGRGSGTGTPSFLAAIDSNWIPSLHSEAYYNTKYAAGGSYISNQTSQQASSNFNISGAGVIGTTLTAPTIYGSTASAGNLTLNSTSNGTKGKINFGSSSFYDEVNTRLNIGTVSPAFYPLEVAGTIRAKSGTDFGIRIAPNSLNFYSTGVAADAILFDNLYGSMAMSKNATTTGIPAHSMIFNNLFAPSGIYMTDISVRPIIGANIIGSNISTAIINGGYALSTGNSSAQDFIINGVQGNGTGTAGDIVFKTGKAAATSGVAHSFTTAVKIKGETQNLVITTTEYADNAAAVAAGLEVGTVYRTGDILKIVH